MMIRRVFLVYPFLAMAGACASNPTGAVLGTPTPLPPPVRVDATQVDTVLYLGVELPIAGSGLGSNHDGLMKVRQYTIRGSSDLENQYQEWMRQEGVRMLREAGYPVRVPSRMFAGVEDYREVRYLLAGAATSFSLDTYAPLAGDRTEVTLAVEWELMDVQTRDVLFATSTSGQAATGGTSGDAVRVAFERAFARLLGDRRLASTMLPPDPPAVVASPVAGADVVWSSPVPPEGSLIQLNQMSTYPAAGESLFQKAAPAVIRIVGPSGHGSGFFISRGGYGLTNHHVADQAAALYAITQRGDPLPLRVVRSDPEADVALVEAQCLNECHTLPLADGLPEVGTDITVIGTPILDELSHTMTRGIVSGVRRLSGITLIQTDAAVNFGNSGGPILNSDGEVVGIITSKITAGGAEGLGFGVEVSDALLRLGIRD